MSIGWFDRAASIHRVRLLLGVILLVAAALKAQSILASTTYLPWYIAAGLVFAELALAGWIFSGVFPQFLWWVTVVCFGCFAIIAAVKIWQGVADCGCFGAFATSPWVALTIDVLALALLFLRYCDRGVPKSIAPSSALPLLPRTIGFSLVLVVAMQTAISISSSQPTLGAIDPTQWVGQHLPVLDDIDVGSEIVTGRWVILFHRSGCGRCGEVLEMLETADRELDSRRAAIIELPLTGGTAARTRVAGILSGQLHGAKHWSIPVPLLIHLNGGRVEAVVHPSEVLGRDSAQPPPSAKGRR